MRRTLLILILAGLTSTVGCRMCAHPFDYCGPTFVNGCNDVCCNPDARAGSVLSPPLHSMAGSPAAGDEVVLEPIPMETATTTPSKTKDNHVVPLQAPPRTARAGVSTLLK